MEWCRNKASNDIEILVDGKHVIQRRSMRESTSLTGVIDFSSVFFLDSFCDSNLKKKSLKKV